MGAPGTFPVSHFQFHHLLRFIDHVKHLYLSDFCLENSGNFRWMCGTETKNPDIHTVDGRNPAPVDMINIPLFSRFHTSQVVQDFVHQQYDWVVATQSFFIFTPKIGGNDPISRAYFSNGLAQPPTRGNSEGGCGSCSTIVLAKRFN